ncbi:response regulator [Nonlabens antarcticus]|uniref:response regulator n=1 Tax=Nonlabens antarcticus TaxID=392714 RepID=UPI0018913B36|nr:response regulator [Nonlabens antarcticus]
MKNKVPKILIVEDSENILEMLELMFEIQGWESAKLKNLNDFVDHVASIAPDIILMDMLLSGANGCDACRTLKSDDAYKEIPIIMMSAHPEARTETTNAGADFFLDKPFEINDLISKIETAIEMIP